MKYNLKDTEVIVTNFKKRLSGVSTTIIQLVPKQKEQKIKINILGFKLPGQLPFISAFALKDLWKKPAKRSFYILHTRRHIEMIFGIILRDFFKAKIKLIFTAAAQRKQKKFTYSLMSKMDQLIAVNPKISPYLKTPHKIIPHGIDTEKFKPGVSSFTFNHNYVIGCLGRIRFTKGTHIFIEAMINLLPEFKDWIAIFAGRITPENKLYANNLFAKIRKANLQKRILFLGEVDNSDIYKSLNLYVSPSLNEGFGLTPLEAMSSGIPAIAGDTGIYSEAINKYCGKIVKPLTNINLINTIKPFFENPQQLVKMGEYARQNIINNYSLEKEAFALNQLYENLFNKL